MGQKFYNNNGEIEYTQGYNEYSPLTVTEKLLLKGFRDKPLPPAQPTLPGVDWNKPMTNIHVTPKKLQPTVKPKTEFKKAVKGSDFYYRPDLQTFELKSEPGPLRPEPQSKVKPKTELSTGGYIDKEQRIYEALNVPGYETIEKSNVSYKKLKEEEKKEEDQIAAERVAAKSRTTKKLMTMEQREKDPTVTYDDWRLETPRYRKHLADLIADDQTNIRWDTTGGWVDKWGDKKTAADALTEQNKIEKSYNEIFPPSEQKKYEQSLLTPVEKKRIEFQKKKTDLANKQITKQKSNAWDGIKKTSKSPQEIKEIRDTVNSHIDPILPTVIRPFVSNTPTWNEFVKNNLRPDRDPDSDLGIASVPEAARFKKAIDQQEEIEQRRNYGLGPLLGEEK